MEQLSIPPIRPWEPCNFPDEIQSELNRRKTNRSFNYVDGTNAQWESDGWQKYKGPMSSWVRLCSNGAGKPSIYNENEYPMQGFIFYGGKDFYSGYGFGKDINTGNENLSIIGYTPDGKPHTIDNDLNTSNYPIHVPPPEIEKITVTIQKELYRRASIEFTCFSEKQLDYLTPYFLIPGISCVLEWGWNHFNSEALIDLNNIDNLREYGDNPYPLYTNHILKSKGNYDVMIGRITHFEWSVDGNKIKCRIEITSQDRLYAGLLIDSNTSAKIVDEKNQEKDIHPFGNLIKFIKESMPKFIELSAGKSPSEIPELGKFITYLKQHRDNWESYLYGIFYGRNFEKINKASNETYIDTKKDFDAEKNNNLWINLGLVVECINFHVSELKSVSRDSSQKTTEIFRIDVDDVVISAHPNLISCDGDVLLIPNSKAPKYFYGDFGAIPPNVDPSITKEILSDSLFGTFVNGMDDDRQRFEADYNEIKHSTLKPTPIARIRNRKIALDNKSLPDYRLHSICMQQDGAYRDDLDELINKIVYEKSGMGQGEAAFPFYSDMITKDGSKPYPANYSGYLKHLYVNVKVLQEIFNDNNAKYSYIKCMDELLSRISQAAGDFWDFRIVAGTGKYGQKKKDPSTITICDNRFMSTINTGTAYEFSYFDSDSILQGISFRPTISNAQTIRTMYTQTNKSDKQIVLSNGTNEILDYNYQDRLMLSNDKKTPMASNTGLGTQHIETMRKLQQLLPYNRNEVLQMTTIDEITGKKIIRRLALPAPEILKMLLDDGDLEINPKYTGIMTGIQATFTLQGIGGLRTFMMFLVRNLPKPYSHENIVFRITDVTEELSAGKWTTIITAGIIPLRSGIKARLGITK